MERPVIRAGITPAEDPSLFTAHCYGKASLADIRATGQRRLGAYHEAKRSMTGISPIGMSIDRVRLDARSYRGLFPDQTAQDLRRQLHTSLETAGFTAAQIQQVTGWSGRTIRRDLQGNSNVPTRSHSDRRDDSRRAAQVDDRNRSEPNCHPDVGCRLTESQVRELRLEYGSHGNAEVAAFLESLSAAGVG